MAPGESSDQIQGAAGTFTFTGSPEAPVVTLGLKPALSSNGWGVARRK